MAWEPNTQQKRDLIKFFQASFAAAGETVQGDEIEVEMSDADMARGRVLYARLSTRFKQALGIQHRQALEAETPEEIVALLNKPLSETLGEMDRGEINIDELTNYGEGL